MIHTISELKYDLQKIGIKPGDTILVHSSYKSMGTINEGAMGFFNAFFDLLGDEGTLIMPSLSYSTVTRENTEFDLDTTPSCVGYLTEFFRTSVPGVIRSIHPTHSCCAKGKNAYELCKDHGKDVTPVGQNSPFAKLPLFNGKILMIGCGKDCNTSLHGVEETVKLPYGIDYDNPVIYKIKTGNKITELKSFRHNFLINGKHIDQCYGRVLDLLSDDEVSYGKILDANAILMDAKSVWKKGHEKLLENPYYFVNIPK